MAGSVRQTHDRLSLAWEAAGHDHRAATGCHRRPTVLAYHALVARPWFINQTEVPVSLEVEDTGVRAYGTDPVQVRSL